jgi:hypothetical protein
MTTKILILLATLLPSVAAAQERPSATAMTCGQASDLVASRGSVVLGTGPATYDRFVAGPGHCVLSEYLEPAYARTRDAPQCLVGYRCRSGPSPQNEQ